MKTKKTTRKAAVKEIPATSVLASLQRKGTEGTCLACKKPIREHFGHRGVWIGCQAKGLDQNTPFLLVPARRRVDVRGVKRSLDQAADRATKGLVEGAGVRSGPALAAVPTIQRSAKRGPGTVTPYVYKAKRVAQAKIDELSGARLDAFKVLKRNSHPLDVKTVAEKSEHPKETTQQLLKFLVDHGFAARQPNVQKIAS